MAVIQQSALICAYHFHQVLPAVIAVNYYREIKKLDVHAPVWIYVPHINSIEENLITTSFPSFKFIKNIFLTKVALMNFMPIKIGSKILKKQHGEKFFDTIFFSHDATSDCVAQTFMQAFPNAERICYGDAFGNLIDRSYFKKFIHKNTVQFNHLLPYLKRKLKPLGCHWLTMQNAVLTVPINFSTQVLKTLPVFVPPKKYAQAILEHLQNHNDAFNHYIHQIVTESKKPIYLFLLTNLTGSKLMTAENEASFFQEIIAKFVPKDATLILKPHAGSDFNAIRKFANWCSEKGYLTHTFSEIFWQMPVELAEELVKNSAVISVSYAGISLSYFFNVSVTHALEDNLIEKYFFADKKKWVSHHNQIYVMVRDKLKTWNGKAFLYGSNG